MKISEKIEGFFSKYFFNKSWRCNVCGKEIFSGEYFCKECEDKLHFIKGNICDHCGRTLINAQDYCSTCKENLLSIDKGRSIFDYKEAVIPLIHKFKFGNKGYLAKVFSEYMYGIYLKNRFDAHFITYVPMTKRAERARGYNQSKLLAEELSKLLNLQVCDCVEKVKDTPKQEGLNRKERLKNLVDAFRITERKTVKGKNVLLVDDVSTTGSTAEAIAERLKRAGASKVYLISVASVPPMDGY